MYTLEVVGNWEVTGDVSDWLRGLDCDPVENRLWIVDNQHNYLLHNFSWQYPGYFVQGPSVPPSNVAAADLARLLPVTRAADIYLNDGYTDSLYFAPDGFGWQGLYPNPAFHSGFGMDVDQQGFFWEGMDHFVLRFVPGFFAEGHPLHADRGHPAGLATFPAGEGEVGVAVSFALDHLMEFYLFTQDHDWQYLGCGTVPWGYSWCFGLVFVPARETFFMLVDGYTCWELLEISVEEMELSPETWGWIKAGFR